MSVSRQPSNDWCKHRHRLAGHHHIAEAPSFATLKQALADFLLCPNQQNREIERLLSGESKHGGTAYRGSSGVDHRGRDNGNL